MVLFGLTIIVFNSTNSNTAVSALILSFLVPAVLFSAVAGVYVDRVDRRLILIATNVMRGLAFVALYLAGTNLAIILLLNVFVSTVTVFFAPAELAMIPVLVPRGQLLAASGIFTLTLNAAFAIGFALLGPLVVKLAGAPTVISVAGLYFLAAFLRRAPAPAAVDPEEPSGTGGEARAVERPSSSCARGSPSSAPSPIGWSLIYPDHGVAIGVLGVLDRPRPADARARGGGLRRRRPAACRHVTGIPLLNSYSPFPRRRVIEGLDRAGHPLLAFLRPDHQPPPVGGSPGGLDSR